MIEQIDYAVQIAAALTGCAWALFLFARTRKLPFLLLGGFYATFGLGNLYLLLHVLFTGEYPFFYTGELAWSAAYVFLLTEYHVLPSPEEKRFFAPAALAAPVLCAVCCVYFIAGFGDPLGNVLLCVPTALLGYFALRARLFARRHPGAADGSNIFHAVTLILVALEYAMWIWSCFWMGDTLSNLYFWCDFAISAVMLLLVPATRRAVSA